MYAYAGRDWQNMAAAFSSFETPGYPPVLCDSDSAVDFLIPHLSAWTTHRWLGVCTECYMI